MSDRWVPRRRPGLRDLLFRSEVDREIREELRFHIEARAELLREREGLGAEEARAEARRRFGDPERWRRACRSTERRRMRTGRWRMRMGELAQDLRFALRMAAKQPGFTAIVVGILGIGIGGTTALFSVADGVLLRPLPYAEPERLVEVAHTHPEEQGIFRGAFSPQDFEDLERQAGSFEHLGAWFVMSRNLLGGGPPAQLRVGMVSEGFFPALGLPAVVGRAYGPADEAEGRSEVVVLSHGLWQRRFGGDPGVVGRSLEIDGASYEVLGVMPPELRFPSPDLDAWQPLSLMTDDMVPHVRGLRWQRAVGALAAGVSPEQAEAEARTILRRLAAEYPDSNEGWTGAEVTPLREVLTADVRPAVWVLFAATGLVLLIACANVANLMLARMTGRRRELAVRVAMGASRGRLLRQGLAESLLLALAGAAVGLAIAWLGVDALTGMSADTVPRVEEIGLDLRAVGFALAAAAGTGILFGLAPAIGATRTQPADALHGGRGSAGSGRSPLRAGLVVGEVALAAVLVIGAGLMLKSFRTLATVDPGFEPERVLKISLRIPSELLGETAEPAIAYRRELQEALGALPGVVAVGSSKTAPLADGGEPYGFERRDVEGEPLEVQPAAGAQIVTPGYFEALGIPVVRGRGFREGDEGRSLVVNRALAERVWPGEEAVGRTLWIGDEALRVLGVVENVRHEGLEHEEGPATYLLSDLFRRSSLTLYARTTGDPAALAESARDAIWQVNPAQPIAAIEPLAADVAGQVARPRFFTVLVGIFGGIALLLAALGIYGVISYFVGRSTAEIGVRMALGASTSEVARLVLRRGVAVSVLGLAAGLLGGFWLSRLLAGLLYGVDPRDPAVFAAVGGLLLLTAVAASLAPALRAARLDPVRALRVE